MDPKVEKVNTIDEKISNQNETSDVTKNIGAFFDRLKNAVPTFRKNKPSVLTIQSLLYVILFVLVAGFLIILIYILFKLYYYHIRMISFGHTAPFEDYMKEHVRLYIICIHKIKEHFDKGGSGGGPLKNIVNELLDSGCIPREEREDYDIDEALYLYLNFMFKRALSGEYKEWKTMELTLLKSPTFGGITTFMDGDEEKNIFNEAQTKVNEDIVKKIFRPKIETFQKLEDYLGDVDCRYKGQHFNDKKKRCDRQYKWVNQKEAMPSPLNSPEGELARQMLIYLGWRYLKRIHMMYDMRKTGGVGNFVIVQVIMADYNDFIFGEMIPGIWDSFFEDIKTFVLTIESFLGSEPVVRFFTQLPLKIAGIEEFTPSAKTTKRTRMEKYIDKMFEKDDEDIVEHFFGGGIASAFKGLAKLIPNLLKILLALVEAITNPLKIVQLILGLIIGLAIYIIYLIIMTLTPLYFIPAFTWILNIKIILTSFWVIVYLFLVSIVLFLWVLDFATNGMVLPLFRCENLPHVWHTSPGYAWGNKYNRLTILCIYPCGNRYTPRSTLFCQRNPNYQPAFCPQQLIMNGVWNNMLGKSRHNSLELLPMTHNFASGMEYFTKSKEDKKDQIEKYYRDEVQFHQNCDKNLAPHDFITRHICQNIDTFFPPDMEDQTLRHQVKQSCFHCYCKYYYEKTKAQRFQQNPCLTILRTQKPVKDKFLFEISREKMDLIDEKMNSRYRGDFTHSYFIHDGFQSHLTLRGWKPEEYHISQLPPRGKAFGFCKDYFALPQQIEEQNKPSRNKTSIIYTTLYTLLMFMILCFIFVIFYTSVHQDPIS